MGVWATAWRIIAVACLIAAGAYGLTLKATGHGPDASYSCITPCQAADLNRDGSVGVPDYLALPKNGEGPDGLAREAALALINVYWARTCADGPRPW